MNAIIYRHKKLVTVLLTLCIQSLIILFLFNYNIRTWIFTDSPISENNIPSDKSRNKDTQVYFDDNIPIKVDAPIPADSKEEDIQDTMKESTIDENLVSSPELSEAIDQNILDTNQETEELSQENTDISDNITEQPYKAFTIPEPIEQDNPITTTLPQEKEPNLTKPKKKRIIRRVVRRVRKKQNVYNPLTQANLLNTCRKSLNERANAQGTPGPETKYSHVTERLNNLRYYSYKGKIHQVLKAEFARYRQPIKFEEDLEYDIKANLIIHDDGSVNFEYENPTGNKDFDDYIRMILNQTKFPPMPQWAKGQTIKYPFNPKLIAKKGSHYYTYQGPDPKTF